MRQSTPTISERAVLRAGTDSAVAALDRFGFLQRRFQRRQAVRVLCYHGVCSDADAQAPWVPAYFVSASQFAAHLAAIARFGPIVSLPEVCAGHRRGAHGSAGIAITFDDVAACTFRHARPILARHNATASFFVSTGHATTGALFPDDVLRLLRLYPQWSSPAGDEALARLIARAGEHKRLPLERLQTLLAQGEATVRQNIDPHIADTLRCLNWDEIRSLAADGHDIGGHTVDHAILGVQDAATRARQIRECLQSIRDQIGRPVLGFAYPNGGPGDFDTGDAEMLRQAGVQYALSTRSGAIEPGDDPLDWPRLCVGRDHTTAKLALELSGLVDHRRRRQQGWSPRPAPHPVSKPADTPASPSVIDPAGMRAEEYARLEELVVECRPRRTLEIGMATGGSAVRLCRILRRLGGGEHTAIDPFQSAPDGWKGQGIARVAAAGLGDWLKVIESPDYLALPALVAQGRRFDFVLIDGWHSFDYTLLDVFYADLLLAPGGVVAVHDTGWPAVYRACRFLETHKAYTRIGPPISVIRKSLIGRLARRAGQVLCGPTAMASARQRRTAWYSLAAYRKDADHQTPNDFYAPF